MLCFPRRREPVTDENIRETLAAFRSFPLQKFSAEFIGTFMLVFIGCGSTTVAWTDGYKPTTVQIALAFGLTVAFLVQNLGHVSGAHVNPAVTVGLLAAGHVTVPRALLYVVAQFFGALMASLFILIVIPVEMRSTLGVMVTAVNPHVTLAQAVFVEALITFALVLTICGACFGGDAQAARGAPFAIGLCITACHLFAMQYTGASMNPARSFGPAMVAYLWHAHWVYWVGPLLGAIAAGVLSRYLFTQTTHEEIPSGPAVDPERDPERDPEPLLQ